MPIKNALERIEAALHTAHYNARRPKEQDIYTEALQDIADIREAVPDGLDQSLIWFEDPGENSRVYASIKAALILQSITATKHKGE